MSDTIAFYVGGADSFNIELDLLNIGRILSNEFNLHLVTTNGSYNRDDFQDYYRVHGCDADRGISGRIQLIREFISTYDPNCVVNITSPTYHGILGAYIQRSGDFSLVQRYPGDTFNDYKVRSIHEKPLYFLLNEVIGRMILSTSDHQIVLGPYGKSQLENRGADSERIHILPPPIDPTRLHEGKYSDIQIDAVNGRNIVLFVGRMRRIKGVEFLSNYIPEILDRRQDLHFVFVGRPDKLIEIPPHYHEHISIVGEVQPELIGSYFHKSDVLISPSLSEAFGRVLVEALLCETPVIARDVGDVSMITENTFNTAGEFIDMVCNFEKLSLDDPTPFTVDKLTPKYISAFNEITSRYHS